MKQEEKIQNLKKLKKFEKIIVMRKTMKKEKKVFQKIMIINIKINIIMKIKMIPIHIEKILQFIVQIKKDLAQENNIEKNLLIIKIQK